MFVSGPSALSFQRGLLSPHQLAAAAADARWAGVCVVDYDGLWSSVQAVSAAETQGIDLAYGANVALRSPQWAPKSLTGARNRYVLDSLDRVQLIARPGKWGCFSRVVSAGHRHPSASAALPLYERQSVVECAADVSVVLGADSDVGRALARGRSDLAYRALAAWRDELDGRVVVGLQVDSVGSKHSVKVSRFMLELCRELSVPCVWQPIARYADPADRVVAHTLDAIRWGQALSTVTQPSAAHLIARETSEGFLQHVADPVDQDRGSRLLTESTFFWQQHSLNGAIDLGLGTAHPPEDNLVCSAGRDGDRELRHRCESALATGNFATGRELQVRKERLDAELSTIMRLNYSAFFLTTATLADLARQLGVRVFARGSAVGSLVCHLLGLTPIDPVTHGLLMARFCTTLRRDLPDIDLDVESARRHDVYRATFAHFSDQRCAAVGMIDGYRSRSALRDVGQAVGIAPGRLDRLAKATPWHGSSDIFHTLTTLPEIAYADLVSKRDRGWLSTVQAISRLPRHASMHPCGLVISDLTLLDRVSTQDTSMGWPMCQLDKDDVESLGLLKADILGVRMQSAIAHTVENVRHETDVELCLEQVDTDDPRAFEVLRSTRTVGLFQVESPGQRALSGKLCAQDLTDITAQISLFRPGPVKADMISPFVAARHGLGDQPVWPQRLRHVVADTGGVVIWHEQVILLLSETMGVSEAEADQLRRRLGSSSQRQRIYDKWLPAARSRGFSEAECDLVWDVLASFGSFGFCKAHAMAFGRTTFETAWLKAHYPAPFFAGLLEHDPGLYPAATILAEARRLGVEVLPPSVQRPARRWLAHRTGVESTEYVAVPGAEIPTSQIAMGASSPRVTGWALQVPLTVIPGVSDDEVDRLVSASPFSDVPDVWQRARPSRDVFHALAEGGGLDDLPGVCDRATLLAQVYSVSRQAQGQEVSGQQNLLSELYSRDDAVDDTKTACDVPSKVTSSVGKVVAVDDSSSQEQISGDDSRGVVKLRQSLRDNGSQPSAVASLSVTEVRRRWSEHVLTVHKPALRHLGVVFADELHSCADKSKVLVAGVRCVVHTPPTRSGIRVVFVSLDDPTGLVDLAFFPDSQGPHSAAAMTSEWVLAEGTVTHTAPRSVSITAHRAWNLGDKINELYAEPEELPAQPEELDADHKQLLPQSYS